MLKANNRITLKHFFIKNLHRSALTAPTRKSLRIVAN